VGNAGLVHDIGVLPREIDDYDLGEIDESEDILNDRRVLPNVVGPKAPKAAVGRRLLDRLVDRGKLPRKRHHHGDQVQLHVASWDLEHVRHEGDAAPRRLRRNVRRVRWEVLVEIRFNDRKGAWIAFYHPPQDREHVARVVFVAPGETSQQTRMSRDDLGRPGEKSEFLPVASIEPVHDPSSKVDQAITQGRVHGSLPVCLTGQGGKVSPFFEHWSLSVRRTVSAVSCVLCGGAHE
jgi:hypothetical protein